MPATFGSDKFSIMIKAVAFLGAGCGRVPPWYRWPRAGASDN
jgi:hypothetical protein